MPKEIEFLKEKAQKFWRNAFDLYSKGEYDLVAFNLEQVVQLFLKYLIAKKIGDWPKTHYLIALFRDLAKTYDNENILKFYNENELFFNSLEDVYFTSRYYPKPFTKNLIDHFIQNCKRFFEFLNKELNEKFSEDIC